MARKVSFFVHDLGRNPIVRAAPFARAFKLLGWHVEILGFSYKYNRYQIYPPFKDEFVFKVIDIPNDLRWVWLKSWQLAKMADGDVIYAFKPKWTTLWPALLASKFGLGKRIIMDAEDNELWDSYIGNGWSALRRSPWYVENPVWNRLLHPLTFLVKRKTVVCRSLQRRYGGSIVLHGLGNHSMKPITASIEQLKVKFAISTKKKIALFAGNATNYNGLKPLIELFTDPRMQNWILLLVGNKDQDLFQKAKKTLSDRCILLGLIRSDKMIEMLMLADAIPIIQSKNRNTEMQIPAKFIEALSMGKPTIATSVCDLGEILSKIRHGSSLIVESEKCIEELVDRFKLLENGFPLRAYGQDAIAFYNQNASAQAIAREIRSILSL